MKAEGKVGLRKDSEGLGKDVGNGLVACKMWVELVAVDRKNALSAAYNII